MNMLDKILVIGMSLLISSSLSAEGRPDQDEYQLRRLQNPTDAELAREKKGQVFIYDGLKDTQVQMAFDKHFDRVQSMMFTRVVVTGNDGNPEQDTNTGEIIVESDGCD